MLSEAIKYSNLGIDTTLSSRNLMIKKHGKVCMALNYFAISYLVFAITGCVSIYAFALLVCIPLGIASPVVRLRVYSINCSNYKVYVNQ